MGPLLRWVVKLGVTVVLFVFIFKPSLLGLERFSFIPVSPGDLWKEIRGIEAWRFWNWMLVALCLKAFAIGASILRWELLLRAQQIRLPMRSLVRIFLMGRFFGTFLPGTLGLDGFRLYYVGQQTGRFVESTTVILFDKLIGFVALTSLVLLTFPLGSRSLARIGWHSPALVGSFLGLLGLALLGVLAFLAFPHALAPLLRMASGKLPGKWQATLANIGKAVTAYRGQTGVFGKALALGFSSHLCTSLMYFGTVMAMATENVGIVDVLFAAPLMIFGTVLGPSVAGEGVRELVFVYLLGPIAGPAKAFVSSHLGFWVEESFALLGGAIFLLSGQALPKRVPGQQVERVESPLALSLAEQESEHGGRSL